MNVLETEWWTIALPPEWWANAEEDGILIGDRDDVGCIEISTLHKDAGEFDADTVRAIAEEGAEAPRQWRSLALGEFAGVGCEYLEEGTAIREWYVFSGALLLFITYSCDVENRGMDDVAVDELLDTLMVAEPADQT